ncbi:unnamed protein product [Brachionus calyciflorus]|uniref:AD domain-containing protein n=1 Tax=Brachionus calyciflorus TaxID=104777 RepID=A0A813SXM1_9BILA|nr:unnamed protein product [Brachionus calyciflorus]
MKERNNSTFNTLNSNSSDQGTNSSSDPYNSNNFMAPPIGAQIRCVTCLGNNVQGKVVAYDQQTKMLALRSPVSGKPGYYDYTMVNVAWCSNLEVLEEPSDSPEQISTLNIQKLERRKKLNIENKLKEINSLGNNVSPLAQHLYFTIYKTLNEVEWEDKNIVVMNSVVISPPYDVNSCHSRNGETHAAVEHVKKIVKKFLDDYSAHQQQIGSK